jgi:hypothetical protein
MRSRGAWAAAALAVLSATAAAQEPVAVVLDLREYVGALQELADVLRAGDLEGARARAQDLMACRVDAGSERLTPDATVLGRIETARDAKAALALANEVALLAAALSESVEVGTPAADPARLDRLRREDEARGLHRGGLVAPGQPPTLTQSAQQALEAVGQRVRAAWRAFRDWLKRIWPKPRRLRDPSSPLSTTATTLALVSVVAAGLALMVFHALRRRGRDQEQPSGPAPAASSRDADPLSREAEEWERYARELAAAGRPREAIRAVYHAVLMSLFRAGLLHHQKGRTNWEYVSRLSAEAPVRPGFMRLTRSFDREWYGRDRSSHEAFAECAEEASALVRLVREGEPA